MASGKCQLRQTDKENTKHTNFMQKGTNTKTGVPIQPHNVKHEHAEHVKHKLTNASRRAAGSNWQLVAAPNNNNSPIELEPFDSSPTHTTNNNNNNSAQTSNKPETQRQRRRNRWGNRHVAMDCEMVGTGKRGETDMLARVSIVNRHGDVLLDKYVRPSKPVVDYRTFVSGIRPSDIEHAEEFDLVQDEVVKVLQGRTLVGHGLNKDLSVLQIKHPERNIRDTSCYKPLARLVGSGSTPSLKRLVHCLLGQRIQDGEHDSVEDARAAMNIYNRCSEEWEKYLERKRR